MDKERQRLLKRLHKLMLKRILDNQHGTCVSDYYRCKRNYGTACDSCKAAAALYRKKQVAQDPAKFTKQKRDSERRTGRNTKGRRRLKGGKHRYWTRQQIIKRDGLNCYLCGIPVDFEANPVQGRSGWEMYPHIDHVIPLALGGDDTIENVKLAHAKCNIDKGVKLLDDEATA